MQSCKTDFLGKGSTDSGLNWCRGVQYVHCVMHKCIMIILGGNEKHIKYVKKHVNF